MALSWAALRQLARQFWCGFYWGHALLPNPAPGKLSLRCWDCGYESAGWEIGKQRPVKRLGGV